MEKKKKPVIGAACAQDPTASIEEQASGVPAGQKRAIFNKYDPIDNILCVLCAIFIIFQVIVSHWQPLPPMQIIVIHGLLCLTVVFLVQTNKRNSKRNADGVPRARAANDGKLKFRVLPLIMLGFALVSMGYIILNYHNLIQTKAHLTTTELIMGILLVIAFWEACREACGWTIPILALIFVAYVFLGQYLPMPFWHAPIKLEYFTATSGVGLVGGVFGTSLTLNANCVFLFMIFGTMLTITKADNFFMEISKAPGRYLAGGPAMTAVVSSCLVGMVTGSGQANVAITGTFTIPLMKKIGYPAAMAGGIESAASTGGSIMPPVMGIVAFVMAQYTGTPYFELIKMAVIPALLYYGCIAIFVHFQAKKLGIMVKETERVNWKRALSAAPLFIVPVIVLVYLLAIGKSLRYTVFYVVITLFLIGLLRKESRATVFDWLHGLKKGVIIGAEIGATMGLVGAMVACMDLTGLLVKFPGIITGLANGNLFIMLILTAVVTIILGCGLPPFACYLLVAMMAASALIKAGLVMMQAHFFIYLFATFALITPPVGLCNVVAAPIAQESYMKVSWQAVRAGCVAWILPVMVIGAPAIILIPLSPLIDWLPRLISCFFLIVMLQVTVVGYFIADTPIWQRLIMGTGAAAIVCYVARGGVLFGLAGLAAFLLVLIWQLAKRARLKNDGRTAQAA